MSASDPFIPAPNSPPPEGTQYIAVIQPALTFLLIGIIFSTLLLPLVFALIALSTSASRKHAVFALNMASICLALLAGILHSYVMTHQILSPTDPLSESTGVAFTLLMSFTPFVVECILLLRLVAVFPPRETPLYRLCAILAIPILTKIARLILLGLFVQCYVTGICSIANISAEIGDNDIRWAVLYVKTTWYLQLLDNTFVSMAFLWQIRKQAMHSRYTSWSIKTRLQGLFYIALTSYVFPTLCCIVELILIYAANSLVPATCVLFFDIYISVFGVAFATVWTTGVSWIDGRQSTIGSRPSLVRGGSTRLVESIGSGRTAVELSASRTSDKNMFEEENLGMTVFVKRTTEVETDSQESPFA